MAAAFKGKTDRVHKCHFGDEISQSEKVSGFFFQISWLNYEAQHSKVQRSFCASLVESSDGADLCGCDN